MNAVFHHTQSLLGKRNAITLNAPASFFFLQLLLLSTMSHGMEYPFGQLKSAVLTMSHRTSCAPPAAGWQRSMRNRKSLDAAQVQLSNS